MYFFGRNVDLDLMCMLGLNCVVVIYHEISFLRLILRIISQVVYQNRTYQKVYIFFGLVVI
jgi:hypothetical protein